jgi:hypothetical protein
MFDGQVNKHEENVEMPSFTQSDVYAMVEVMRRDHNDFQEFPIVCTRYRWYVCLH